MLNIRRAWLTIGAGLILILGAGLLLLGGPGTEASHERSPDPMSPKVDRNKGGGMWGADYFPNVPLITHDGETVRFFDDLIKDRVVAINFIYTTCPDACPMETARMKEVQQLLGDRVGEDVFFYSITIDPDNDTPEVLHEYVKNWQIGDGWTFLTGKEEDIVLLRQKLGIYIPEIQSEDSNDHNLSLIVGNQATGRWMKRSPYENPYVLATQLGSWLHNWKLPSETERSYEDAPELRQISTGELLFRTRCASCHTIGQGDIREVAQRRVGPDLYNVTQQRDPRWLERWLMEPDVMLEEKDPLAMALYEQYNQVPMPNLRLTETDVVNVVDYIEEASRRVDEELADRQVAVRADGSHQDHHGDHLAADHADRGDHHQGSDSNGGEHRGDHRGEHFGGHDGEHHEPHGDHPGHGEPHAGSEGP